MIDDEQTAACVIVINYMDMYRILKETLLAWKGGRRGLKTDWNVKYKRTDALSLWHQQ